MRVLLALFLCAAQMTAYAGGHDAGRDIVTRWVSHPDHSTLEFVGLQEGAPFSGRFDKFNSSAIILIRNGTMVLESLNTTINLMSVDTRYSERDKYLLQSEWFDTENWPEARFTSTKIIQLSENDYVAEGNLLLRGVKQPTTIRFELTLEEGNERARLRGTGELQRLDFGVGAGEWADTSFIGNQIDVDFDLLLIRAFE